MKISSAEKENIFNMLKEDFDYSFKGYSFHDLFNEAGLFEKGYNYESGAVKYCIFHKGFGDFVVKFCLEKFNYCEREYTNYLAAVNKGLERFFPYTDFLGNVHGVDFYLQERASCEEGVVSDIWYSAIRETYEPWRDDETEDDINDHIWDMIYNLEDEERLLYCFGEEDELLDFINEFCINDLHEGNFGYIDGRLIIIDFSGYGWKAKEREF